MLVSPGRRRRQLPGTGLLSHGLGRPARGWPDGLGSAALVGHDDPGVRRCLVGGPAGDADTGAGRKDEVSGGRVVGAGGKMRWVVGGRSVGAPGW